MRNFSSSFDDEDLLETRDNRNSTVNRPSIDPGMGEDDDDWGSVANSLNDDDDSPFSSESSPWGSRSNSLGGLDSELAGIGGMSHGFNNTYAPENSLNRLQNTPMDTSYEDKFFKVILNVLSKFWGMLKEVVTARKTFDLNRKILFGKLVMISGFALCLLSLVGMFLKIKGMGNLFLGTGISGGIGITLFMFAMNKKINLPEDNDYSESEFEDDDNLEENLENESDDGFDEDLEDDPEENSNSFSLEDTEDEPIFDIDEDKSTLFAPTKKFEDLDEKESVTVDPLDVIKNINDSMNFNMLTRQYLYDSIVSCLKNKKSNFAESIVLDEDSREFLGFCKMVDDASETLSGFKIDDTPSLLKAEDRLFYSYLEISRPKWFKQSMLDNFVTEIVSICQYDATKGKKDPKIYGMGDIVGNRIYIKIMKGQNAMISIKDTYDVVKDKILDLKNKMPVVLGIDEEGDVSLVDLTEYHSLLITGQPRTGKSWIVKAIIFQLMMLCKPSQFQLYIGDAKNTTSDFYFIDTPHIRQFASTDEDILQMVRDLVHIEGPRRTQMFLELGGYKDISDVHKAHPEVELPYIYLLIDEVVTLASRMEDDVKREFQDLLHELTTRMPALGIRPFLVPHELKDKIIRKSITDMIPFRVSVCGTPTLIENAVNAKPSEFKYKLSNRGDMAVRFSNSEVGFVHGSVITDDNQETDRLFNFLTNFWLKLDPKSFKGSRMEKDIREHKRVINTTNFPPEVIEMISQVQKESLTINRPTRNKPKIEKSEELLEDEDIEIEDDIEEVVSEVSKKRKITRATTERTIGQLNQKSDVVTSKTRGIQRDDTLK